MSETTIKNRLIAIENDISLLPKLKQFKINKSIKIHKKDVENYLDENKKFLDGDDIDIKANYKCDLIEEMITYYVDELDLNNNSNGGGTTLGINIQPFISPILNPTILELFVDTTFDITIYGELFDEQMSLYLGDEVTVNSLTIVNSSELIANVTTSSNLQALTPLELTRDNSIHYGADINVKTIDSLTGTGSAGTFTTDFNYPAGTTGQNLWGNDWLLEVFGSINSVDGYFNSSTAGTPSSNTGASDGRVFGISNVRYAYSETSGSNSGTGSYAQAVTTNFNELTNISLKLYLYGSQLGEFKVETQNADNTWTTRYSVTGQQHSNGDEGDNSAINVNIDTTSFDVKAVRLVFGETTGFQGDYCIDDIVLTSI